MNGKIAAREGKKVYYVTSVGIFQLTEKGLELIQVMPGIDIERDILRSCQAKIIVPKGGDIPIVGQALLTGQGFALALRGEALT
jgi:propionate CoA-transferase